jgi:hypothetical protein
MPLDSFISDADNGPEVPSAPFGIHQSLLLAHGAAVQNREHRASPGQPPASEAPLPCYFPQPQGTSGEVRIKAVTFVSLSPTDDSTLACHSLHVSRLALCLLTWPFASCSFAAQVVHVPTRRPLSALRDPQRPGPSVTTTPPPTHTPKQQSVGGGASTTHSPVHLAPKYSTCISLLAAGLS